MATAKEVREEIRAAIGDDDSSDETYTDYQVNIFIRAALKRLKNRVGLSITISNGTFSSTPDDAQADLISLQAQCIISHRQFRDAVKKGVRVRQDENEIDTSAGLGGYKESVAGEYSACGQLEEAIADYLKNNPDLQIESTTSKYASNIWAGNSKLYDDVDYDGQGNDRLWSTPPGNIRRNKQGGSNHRTGGWNDAGRFSSDA